MNDFSFENLSRCFAALKSDISVAEFAEFAQNEEFSEQQIIAVNKVFEYLRQKKNKTTILTIMKMSRLPNFNEDDSLLCALDRIFDDATVFTFRGESFRGKNLEKVVLQTSRIKTSSEKPNI